MKLSPAFLVLSVALARPREVNILHQMPAEGGAACLLDVEEHHHVGLAAHVEGEVVLEDVVVGDHVIGLLEVHVVHVRGQVNFILLQQSFILCDEEGKNPQNYQNQQETEY